MRIREFRDEELPAVAELFTAAVHELAVEHYDQRQRDAWAPVPPDLDRWQRRLAAVRVLVADDGAGELAGFVGYADSGHIDMLFVAPSHARRGVAAALHARAESAIRNRGSRALFTEASEVARPFFASQGYAVERSEVVEARGVELHRYVMRKALAPNDPDTLSPDEFATE